MAETKIEHFTLRFAGREDVPLVYEFIRMLADYEKMLDEVEATEAILEESIFDRNGAEVLIGEYDGKPAGFALFFHNISTFTGKRGIYLEDLFVRPEYRGKGLGRVMLSYLAKLAVERDCARFEWACLDWNEPSIRFYKGLGATAKDEWTGYRLDKDALLSLASEF